MAVELLVRNESRLKRLYRRDVLRGLAGRICSEEGLAGDIELSVLFCDDSAIAALNRKYRRQNRSTDVLAFSQDGAGHNGFSLLGDIVISLETVEHRCAGYRAAMREEVRLLFCHGLLHLLGYDHATKHDCQRMAAKQAQYLGLALETAWPKASQLPSEQRHGRRGGLNHFGR